MTLPTQNFIIVYTKYVVRMTEGVDLKNKKETKENYFTVAQKSFGEGDIVVYSIRMMQQNRISLRLFPFWHE